MRYRSAESLPPFVFLDVPSSTRSAMPMVSRLHARWFALALLAMQPMACTEKTRVTSISTGDAHLGVNVALGALAADGDITAVRVVARYSTPSAVVVLKDVTVAYAQGQTRDVTLSLDIAQCLRDVSTGAVAATSCPVQVTVDVLANTRVLARDVLPVVQVRAGESASTPALAARGATSVRLIYNGNTAPTSVSLVTGATAALSAEPLDAASVAIAGRVIVWTTSAPAIASVSATGVITGIAVGSATVAAITGTGAALVQNSITVNIAAPIPASIEIAPTAATIAVGATQLLTTNVKDAAGVAITPTPALTFTSAQPTVATVSATGTVTAIAAGSTIITARTANGVTGTATISVFAVPATVRFTPTAASLGVGATQTFVPIVSDAAGVAITPTPSLQWSSSLTTVASVTQLGVVTAVAPGTATITATTTNGVIGTATVLVAAVPASVTLAPLATTLNVGATQTLTPTVRDATQVPITPTPVLTWTTSAATVATVSQAGVVTAVAPGTASITAQTANGFRGTATFSVLGVPASLTLSPLSATLGVGATQAFTALVRDATGLDITTSSPVTWTSGNTSVATVSTTGVVTAVANGATTINVQTANNVTASAPVTVGTTGTYSGRVFDFETNSGIAGATITFNSGGQVQRTVTSDNAGNYTSGSIVGGPFDIGVAANGYASASIAGTASNGAQTLAAIPLVKTAVGGGTISGTVLNATTNQQIVATGTLDLYAGVNTTTGIILATTTTATSGFYQFSTVNAGTYTVSVRATGFSNGSRTVVSLGAGRVASSQNVLLAPTSSTGSLRIVLTWGALPADLDSHLTGPSVNQTSFWVYYGSRGSCTTIPYACLDVDATNGYGPETITIAQRTTGRYVYSVHNYSAGDVPSDVGLSGSGARVDVYGASGLLQSFAVPALPGTLWTVFDWDGVTIRPINTISGLAPPASSAPPGALRAEPAVLPPKIKR